MNDSFKQTPLRLWPGVVIVVLQLFFLHLPGRIWPASALMFYGMLGSLMASLLVLIWWLFFSRAGWRLRLGGLALLIVVHAVTVVLADPSAKMVAFLPGVPWLCAIFVASLFFRSRTVTIVAVLVASLAWTLVRTEGVTGTMATAYGWRWGETSEQQFLASDASAAPLAPAAPAGRVETAAWSGFRGAHRDGVLAGVTIDTDWSTRPPQQIWRRPVGPGWSSFVLVGTRLCTLEQRDEDEVVVCYDAASGEPIWLHAYPARFWEAMGGPGPRATPAYHDGRLYALGGTGVLNCLDASTGEPVWTRNLVEDTGAPVPTWAFSSSPLVVGDLVVVHAPSAPEGRGLVGYDLATGEPRWFGQAAGASYSSPHLATIDGVRQIVMISADGVSGFEVETGERLWRHEWPPAAGGDRVVQPAIVDGGSAILMATVDGGTRKLAVSSDASGAWSADEVWTSRALKSYYNDLVVHRGTAFGFDRNILAAIDVASGDRVWKGGRYGNGQVLLLPDQDLLLVLSEEGELALVRATTDGYEEVARVQALDGKTWNHPIFADGVVYLRNSEEAAAYRLAP